MWKGLLKVVKRNDDNQRLDEVVNKKIQSSSF